MRRHWFSLVRLLVVTICAALSGRAAAHWIVGNWLLVTAGSTARRVAAPIVRVAAPRARDPAALVARNIFCSGCRVASPGGKGTAVRSALEVELIATMFCPSDPAWSVALLRDRATGESQARFYRSGMRVGATGATVAKVLTRRVYLLRDGRLEYLELGDAAATPWVPPDASAREVACRGARCEIARALVERTLANPAVLAASVRAWPVAGGLHLESIQRGSLLAQLGLQPRDLVRAVNGMELSSPENMLDLLIKLRYAQQLSVAVDRQGARLTLDYTIR